MSKIAMFQVGSNPTVSITFPTNGQTFPPDTTITISATAAVGITTSNSITNVDFFVNNQFIGNATAPPFEITQCCWKPGRYVLNARATDSFGLQAVSSNVTILVAGEPPAPQSGFWDENFGLGAAAAIDPGMAGGFVMIIGPDGNPYTLAKFLGPSAVGLVTTLDGTNWVMNGNNDDINTPICYLVDGTKHFIGGAGFGWNGVINWDGSHFTAVGGVIPLGVMALTTFQGSLYVAGSFGSVDNGGTPDGTVQFVTRFDAASGLWKSVGNGLPNGTNGSVVLAMTTMNNELYIGGYFTNAGGNTNANYIAKLVGNTWTNVGAGVSATNCGAGGFVTTLAACGTNLYVGGFFDTAGGLTNANGVAIWNGKTWRTLNGGIVANSNIVVDQKIGVAVPSSIIGSAPRVFDLVVRGDRLYVCGLFTQVLNGAVPITANNIATALWDEGEQSWTWSSMDLGFGYTDPSGDYSSSTRVKSLAINELNTNGAYDLYVSGEFTLVGSALMPDVFVARWRVGLPNTNTEAAPIVQITSPASYIVYTNPASVPVDATVAWLNTSDTASPASLYANGTLIETTNESFHDTNFVSHFNFTWNSPTNGVYSLQATASENNQASAVSETATSPPVYVSVKGTNDPVIARDDVFWVLMNQATNLYVLTNDTSSNGPLHIAVASPVGQTSGSVSTWANGRFLTYKPAPYTFGQDTFTYIAEDPHGNSDSAHVTVNVLAPPAIYVTAGSPTSTGIFSTNPIPITNWVTSYDAPVTNVTVMVNGSNVQTNTGTNVGTFGFNWSNSLPNIYTFTATAVDTYGITNTSEPITILVTNTNTASTSLTASIGNLPVKVTEVGPASVTNYTIVQSGLYPLSGTAGMSSSNATLAYQLMLFRPQDNSQVGLDDTTVPYRNVTPIPPGGLNASGFRPGGDSGGNLGQLDLSGIPNGTYDLQLTVTGNGAEKSVVARFMLETQMKIGELTFSQQDMVLPANGIPLTVTRTYNSMNPQSADFGYGWTFSVNSMNVQLDEERTTYNRGDPHLPFDDGSGEGPAQVSIRTGGGRDVTLTLPNGQQTTFQFTPQAALGEYFAAWTPPENIQASLETTDEPTIEILFGAPFWNAGGEKSSWDNFDTSGWILTTQDGTQYHITRQPQGDVMYTPDPVGNSGDTVDVHAYGPPQLSEIDELSGDRITIDSTGMTHIDASRHATRSVYFDRDTQNRIIALYDATAGSNGLPIVKYVYDQNTGNLIEVLKLQDRTAGTYVTNMYRYDNPNFPHYITAIQDADGVPIAENLYDSNGLLTNSTDADGNTTTFIHNTSNQVDVVVDRAGNTNSYVYDANGNVTAITNALGQVTTMAYDALNDKTNEIIGGLQTNNYAYDGNGFMLQSITGGLMTNTFAYNGNGQVLTNIDGRGNLTTNNYDSNSGNLLSTTDALTNVTTYTYYNSGQLASSVDALGNQTINYYDGFGNLSATAMLDAGNTILSTNSFLYDANGNQTNSTVWRRVSGTWTNATTAYVYDGQNRVVQTIEPDGYTNSVVYDNNGRQSVTIDKLNRQTQYFYDDRGNLTNTTYPDMTSEQSFYDAAGRRTNSVDRAGNPTYYVYDALNRVHQTIFPDTTTNTTVYDAAGRVAYSVDARGTTNAFCFDAAGRRTSVTNAWGHGLADGDDVWLRCERQSDEHGGQLEPHELVLFRRVEPDDEDHVPGHHHATHDVRRAGPEGCPDGPGRRCHGIWLRRRGTVDGGDERGRHRAAGGHPLRV